MEVIGSPEVAADCILSALEKVHFIGSRPEGSAVLDQVALRNWLVGQVEDCTASESIERQILKLFRDLLDFEILVARRLGSKRDDDDPRSEREILQDERWSPVGSDL